MASDLSRRRLLEIAGGTAAGGALLGAWGGPMRSAAADTTPPTPVLREADIESARNWWPAQKQVWTPLGWKGHLFRFNQFYNGTVVCDPGAVLSGPKPDVQPYQGKNFQLTVTMPDKGGTYPAFPKEQHEMWDDDLGLRRQGWVASNHTPLLWTEFRRQEGLVLREYAFAHVKGGQAVQSAIEPIYAWIRFAVEHVDERMAPDDFTFTVRLSKAFLKPSGIFDQQDGVPVLVEPDAAPLDGPLQMDRIWNPDGHALTVPIHDDAGNVRLIVGTPAHGSITLTETAGTSGVYDLRLGIPAQQGVHLDLMVPMLVEPDADADAEWALGYEGALDQCETFWAPIASTVASVQTPEPHVNEYVRRSPQLAQVVAEKSTDTHLFTFLSGSYAYDVLWSTPTSMVSHMFLDLLGYHDVVEQHIEIYKTYQGTRTPPGPVFEGKSWPGYLSTPASLQAIDWMSDHGAILEILAVHALLTDRQEFIQKWLDPIVLACDFIKQALALTDHNGVPGLVPPAVNSDENIVTQGISSQAWTHKGLRSAIQLLRRVNHPRAEEFNAVADEFQQAFIAAMRKLAADSPTWTDPDGVKQPILPASFTGERGSFPELVMFDGGALMAVWAGLMPATDELMRSYLEFYRVGPNTLLFDPDHHNALDRPILEHEQSSGEPCYSWNLFHSWQLADRARYLESMYGLIIGAISQDTFISCEHRNAIYGNLFAQPIITWAMRHAVIDDEIVDDELHLLRICPLAWLSATETAFERIPTRYGPITLRWSLSGNQLTVSYSATWHHRPQRIVLHPPPIPGLRWITVNDHKLRVQSDRPIEL